MNYVTKKGTFPTLQEMRYAYLEADGPVPNLDPGHHAANAWDSTLLHASEVGYCQRRQMLRLSGAPPAIQANLTKANEQVMFWVANRLHGLAYSAMEWAGILIDHEASLMEPPWAGRADAIFRPDVNEEEAWLYDMKTVRPNAMKYSESFPKPAHCLQLGAYGSSLPHISKGIIEVVDRGGSNPPIECVINLGPWVAEASALMAETEGWMGKDELPPMLQEGFVPHYRKAPGQDYKDLKSVTYECSWECGFCEMHHTNPDDTTRPESPCKPPNHAPVEVAKVRTQKEGGGWAYNAGMAAGMNVTGIQQVIATFTPRVPVFGGEEE
jgi:hypothetical protein